MCSCLGKQTSSHSTKPGINSSSGFNENAKSSASGGEEFLPIESVMLMPDRDLRHFELTQQFVFQSPQGSIFHPPKALPLL